MELPTLYVIFFLRHFVDSVVESSNAFLKKKKTFERYFISPSADERSPETKSFVTDVDVRGSRAWYNTVKMAVFTLFVIAATASDDEIHKQPPTVDLHIQMGFFSTFVTKYRHSSSDTLSWQTPARRSRAAISCNNNITQTYTRTSANYSRFSARENHASFRETENPTSSHSQLGQIAGAMQ